MLTEKHALVTGGGTGIGFAIAQALAEAGAQVTITGRRAEVLQAAGPQFHPLVMDVTYSASKFGVVGLIKALAQDFAGKGITCNALCPAYVETEIITRNVASIQARTGVSEDAALQIMVGLNPHGRLIAPEEIAQAALWLCGPGSDSVNGQAIEISGGVM